MQSSPVQSCAAGAKRHGRPFLAAGHSLSLQGTFPQASKHPVLPCTDTDADAGRIVCGPSPSTLLPHHQQSGLGLGLLSPIAAQRLPSTQSSASNLNPDGLFPTSLPPSHSSILPFFFSSSVLLLLPSAAPFDPLHPSTLLLLHAQRPRGPTSIGTLAPGFKFSTLLIRFPTHSVACDDFRFATPCERARLLPPTPPLPLLLLSALFNQSHSSSPRSKSRSSQPPYPG